MKRKTKEQLLEELESLKERLNKLEKIDIEQKKVIEALSESEAKYRLLFDAAPVGIGIADLEGNIIDANTHMQEISGYSLDEYKAISVEATYADLEERKLLLKTLQEKGKVRDWEAKLKRKDGSQYHALLNVDRMELGGRKVILGIIRDISHKKQNEVALKTALANAQEEKNKSEAIISALGDGIIIQDTEYKITYQNQVQNEIYGDKTGELCYKAYEGRDQRCEDCPVERTFRDGKIHRSEKKVTTDNGDFYFELTSSPLRDSDGKIISGIKVVREITGQKRTEEKLREGEHFLENIFSSIQDGIGVIDTDMNIIRVNETAQRWYPYAAPLVGKKCYVAYHNRKERCEQCPAWETLKTGKSAYKVVPKHGPEGKEVGWLEIYSYPLNDTTTGRMNGVIEYVRDITELKLAEKALQKSEEKFRGIFEQSPIAIELYDREGNLIDANRSCLDLFGINDIKSVMGFKLFEDPNIAEDKKRRLSNGGNIEFESVFDFELVKKARLYKTTRSGKCYLDILIVPLITEERERYGYLVHLRDITERKHMEEELKQSEEKYRLLIENIQEGVFVIQDAKMVFANQALAEITGHSIEEIIGTDFYHFVAPEDLEMVKDRYYRRQKGENVPEEYEFHALRKNGEKPIVNMNVGIVPYRGRIASMGILRDITFKKRAEEKLKLFSETVQNAPDGVQIVDLDGKIIYSNKAVEQIFGFSNDELIGKNVGELNVDPEIAGKEIIPGINEKGSWTGEFLVRHKNGHEFPIWLTTSLVKDEIGVPIAMVGIIRDITQKRKVEEALLESEKRYRTLFESAGDAIFILETEGEEGRIVEANQTAARIHGYSIEELLTMNIDDLNTRESRNYARDFIKRILNGETIKAELDHCSKDGTVFPVEINAGLLELGGHKYILAFDRDITKRKRAEEGLRMSNIVVENSQTVLFRWKAQEDWPVEFVSNNVVQFGYSAQDFLSGSLPYASIIHADDIERVSREVRKHSEGGDDRFQQEYRIIAKNGAVHWVDDRTVIERKEDGQITHYQGIIIDITERKRTEEAIKKYNKELEESNRMKELFTDIMHHDLLNPLNVANGYVELFLDDETNPRKKSYLETIKRNLVRGMDLIDNATKFSKLESMSYIEFEDVDLKIVIGEAVANLTPLALSARMSIENKLKGSMPARANKIIEDVFINIISNAIKYAPEGKKIVVEGKDMGKSWSLMIKDFGEGIKDPEKTLIFERFHREEKKGVKGSGLGLAIAGKIVELHKGRIWVVDNPEGGAVFVVEIPKR